MRRKGINLIELIMVIVILSVAIPPLFLTLADINYRGNRGEIYYQGIILGRDLLEELLSRNFSDINICTNPSTCPYSDTVRGYTREVSIRYIDPDINSPPLCPDGSSCPLDNYVSYFTNYKRIDISVSHNLMGELCFSVVVSSSHEPE